MLKEGRNLLVSVYCKFTVNSAAERIFKSDQLSALIVVLAVVIATYAT